MAIVSKGGGSQDGGSGPQAAEGGDAPERTLHNLPPKTGPITGRKPEMHAIAKVFTEAAQAKRAGRVEIVGKSGVGATSVALELARRVGGRFPGGAWYIHLGMGGDVAWADAAATAGATVTSDLRRTAEDFRAALNEGPKALLIVDGVTDPEQLAFLPEDRTSGPDVFAVSETSTGVFEDIVEVSDVPDRGPRRIAHAVFQMRDGEETDAPAVRSLDGLAVTATLAARAAVAYEHQNVGPISIPDHRAAVMSLMPLMQQHPISLEVLMLCGVAHPLRISVDALYGAVTQLHTKQDEPIEPKHVGQGVLWLAQLGIVMPDDQHRVSMHPLVQETVRSMASTDRDLSVARQALAFGLIHEAEEAVGDDGVDIHRAALHQLRHVLEHLEGEAADRTRAVLERVERAAGL
jgi:hypothetical protein